MSDDDFDLDFVNRATDTVKAKWASKIIDPDMKDDVNTEADEKDEIPTKKKKGKISGFMDSPMVTKKVTPARHNDSEEDDEIKVRDKKERPEITLTPPGSPAASPETKSARGTRRTKKTEQALRKIQKNKGSTTGRFNRLRDLDEDNWRPPHIPVDQSFELKIRWKMEWLRFTVKPQDRMSQVIDFVAKETGMKAKDLNLYKDDTSGVPLPLDKSVQDLGLSLLSLLSARAKVVIVEENAVGSGDGSIEVKLQTKDRRAQPVLVRLQLTDKMQTVIDKFCEQSNTDKDRVKVFFDGDQLNPEELAGADLELEGGECFDVHISDK